MVWMFHHPDQFSSTVASRGGLNRRPCAFLLPLLLSAALAFAADEFVESPLQREDPNNPHGTVIKMPAWESKIFPDTTRDWSIYVPAQYKPETPAAVADFQADTIT